jgi:RimK family alpha-L-glutamate ligase
VTVVQLRPPRGGAVADKSFFLLAGTLTKTNAALLACARELFRSAARIQGEQLASRAGAGDVVLARLDVRRSLDGVERGLWDLEEFEDLQNGAVVLNPAGALLTAHDKLATAITLATTCLPHPRTHCVETPSQLTDLELPVVVKPRFGSWGADVHLCHTQLDLKRCFGRIAKRPWFQLQGALVQELIPPRGRDLRVVVAAGTVVGAVERVATPGQWRTNVALGAVRRPVPSVPRVAAELAVRAAAAVGADLVGVDLLPLPNGDWTVLELNGAVDFSQPYALDGKDIYGRALGELLGGAAGIRTSSRTTRTTHRAGMELGLLRADQPMVHDDEA